MIKAVMKFETLEVEITGQSIPEFAESLGELQSSILPGDREWRPDRRLWVVRNVDRYKHLPWVARALEDRSRQQALF